MECVFYVVCYLSCFLVVHATLSGLYVDNGVDQTVMHRRMSRKEKKEMQHEILSLLGLHNRPRPVPHGVDNSAPKFLLDVYKSVLGEDEFSPKSLRAKSEFNLSSNDLDAIGESDVIMSFVNHVHHLNNLRHERDKVLWFDVTEAPIGENIVAAELRLYKEKVEGKSKTISIIIHQLVEGKLGAKELLYIDSVNTSLSHEGWLQINVTKPLISWVTFPSSNLGLYISILSAVEGHEMEPKDVGLVGHKGEEGKQPFMVGFFKSLNQHDIHIRSTRDTRRRKKAEISHAGIHPWSNFADPVYYRRSGSCQRQNLFVSFMELNWSDWIIAPEGYAAYFCHGECAFPLNAHMNATNHAIVQTLANLMKPEEVPKPCCAPTKLSPISVLYFLDESNVILKKYKNMVVKSCGCH